MGIVMEVVSLFASILSLIVSLFAVIFVYRQVKVAEKSNRATVMTGLIDALYSDKGAQDALDGIYAGELVFIRDKVLRRSIKKRANDAICTKNVDILLNRFQILGHLFDMKILTLEDLHGLEYEILMTGRNEAIRGYLGWLNTVRQETSGVIHDHFRDYKQLYLALEYEPKQSLSFKEAVPFIRVGSYIRRALEKNGKLTGKKVVVTAGGTQEPLDPVRYITNRSSGKQGYALAQAALDLGADVCLITTPTALTHPIGVRVVRVRTAQEMLDAVLAETDDADALVMAAAVADFRPIQIAKDKMKRREGIPQIELEATPDVLKTLADKLDSLELNKHLGERKLRVAVGFAAESRDLLENASEKLESKKLDFIVANDISAHDAGFGTETNRVTLLFANGRKESFPLMSKSEVATKIIEHIVRLLE